MLGEQIYPAFVREKDGRTRIGYIDTADVSGVVCHPDNSMQMSIIMVGGSYENPTKAYRIIRHDDDYVDGGRVEQAKHPGKLVTAEQANVEPWEMAMLKEKGCESTPVPCSSSRSTACQTCRADIATYYKLPTGLTNTNKHCLPW
ncbi:MAG: hypothetical protein IPK63_15955 [Candidatus Competibacteraceae bacterium]|nr:hypothetical protein [Candidatus Competibacteraceae bacterium]